MSASATDPVADSPERAELRAMVRNGLVRNGLGERLLGLPRSY
jgi:hypothetical protein